MNRVIGNRASSVLYNILISNKIKGKALIPANICESVPATYMKAGLEIELYDISLSDFRADEEEIINIIKNDNISVLHYNHTYGLICKYDDIFISNIRRAFPDLFIVDDRCLAFPETEIYDQAADLVLFSTGKTKCVNIGWGGFGFISNRIRYCDSFKSTFFDKDLIQFERHMKECHEIKQPVNKSIIMSDWLNFDYNPNNYFEKVLEVQERSVKHKKKINDIYLSVPGSLPIEFCSWRYQLLLKNSKECSIELFKNNLYCSSHYMSLGNGYYKNKKTPVSDYLETHILNLFNDFSYTKEQAEKTVAILNKIAVPEELNNLNIL